jgi:N-acyl-phosphatidylethanolamine-hydrolysing phospholipase D
MYAKFLLVPLLLLAASCATPPSFDEGEWRRDVESQDVEALYAPHFKDGLYFNPWMAREKGRFGAFLKWRLTEKQPYSEEERGYKPEVLKDLPERIEAAGEGDFIAWIGHATFLMRLEGAYWLTDPMFSDRALLPKRVTPPAIRGEGLREIAPRVNVVLSHNHYDHLDADSIEALPEGARVFVPPGLGELVQSYNAAVTVKELDWWQSVEVGEGVKLTSLPTQHWSRRIGQSTNESLWASYLLETPSRTIYFGGDSGYFVGYREFGKRFPAIDYALMPVTAYHPRWFMHYAHMNAEEALDAFQELGARYFIPTQWGAFNLGDNPAGYPALDLKRLVEERGLDPSRFLLPDVGGIVLLE